MKLIEFGTSYKELMLKNRPSKIIKSPYDGDAVERIVSDIYDQGMVTSNERDSNGTVSLIVWLTHAARQKLISRWKNRIEVK